METLITILLVAGAGVWFVFWLRGKAKGTSGCSCGGCGNSCPNRIIHSCHHVVDNAGGE